VNNLIVLVDTNVLIAAMLGSRTARKVLTAIITIPCRWIISPELMDELDNVPLRPNFKDIITWDIVQEMRRQLQNHAQLIHPKTVIHVCRDPQDDHVLAAAVDSHAMYVVTGDHDLLSLTPFRGVAIVTPAEFLSRLENHLA